MKSKLLDTLFFLEKRKNLLLFLADSPKSSGEIKEAFDFSWISVVLYGKNGVLTNQYLLCQEPGALKWGEELFMHYMNNSKQICDYEVILN